MRYISSVAADSFMFLFAGLCAFFLRVDGDNFTLMNTLLNPYLFIGFAVCFLTLLLVGVGKEMWSFTTSRTYFKIVVALAFSVIAAIVVSFFFVRLDGVPRSVPFLQFLLACVFLSGGRKFVQMISGVRERESNNEVQSVSNVISSRSAVIVGVNNVAGVLLKILKERAGSYIDVVGFVSSNKNQVGRSAFGIPVLGCISNINDVFQKLETHGAEVCYVIFAESQRRLFSEELDKLKELELTGRFKLMAVEDVVRLSSASKSEITDLLGMSEVEIVDEVHQGELIYNLQRNYWMVKRFIDFSLAFVALIIASPVFLLVAGLVYFDAGAPIFFWQRRPGIGGRPFRVLKFRTMREEFNSAGHRLSDEQRTSSVGHFLRRTRLDELPQLLNILKGDMAIIGPRPLLPKDQCEENIARLYVRPGLTGWAQVIGGRTISAKDKAALDVWYVYNASFLLDIKIVLKTIPMVLFGEKVDHKRVDLTLAELDRMNKKMRPLH